MEGYAIGQVGHASLGQNVVVSVVTSVAYFKKELKDLLMDMESERAESRMTPGVWPKSKWKDGGAIY